MNANVTLLYNGQTEEAFNFYRSIFGGEFIAIARMSDMPGEHTPPPEYANKILHMTMSVGSSIISGMDLPPGRPPVAAGGNFMININTDSETDTTRFYNELAASGEVKIPLGHQFWGPFFGMVTDKFGITWMLNYVNKEQS